MSKSTHTHLPTTRKRPHPAVRVLGHIGFFAVFLGAAAWTATALFVHFSGPVLVLAEALLALAALGVLLGRYRARRAGWASLAAAALIVGAWYQTIQPSDQRIWAFDVARGVTADVAGDSVTLHNIRSFRWKDEDTADEAWVSQTYDLRDLTSVDMLTSVWDDPDIAHLLVSFGFATDQHVVFSVEIRREQGEEFSVLGGFFRQFEMVLIAADEQDIVKLRTNYRKEDVRLYPIKLDQARMQKMFMAYVDLGNDLAARPAFYNTILANCSTAVYRLAKVIVPDMPLDIRLIKTGRLYEYLADLGGLQGEMSAAKRFEASAITQIAQATPEGQSFSTAIRAGEISLPKP
ncbi:MAG: DUF4105 domain-containing protein [Albidovulum sp.]